MPADMRCQGDERIVGHDVIESVGQAAELLLLPEVSRVFGMSF